MHVIVVPTTKCLEGVMWTMVEMLRCVGGLKNLPGFRVIDVPVIVPTRLSYELRRYQESKS